MKIIIAPDSYKESLTAMEVATAIEAGFRQVMPNAEYIKLPMADGGEGTVQSLIDASNGTIIHHPVTGPLGEQVQGFFGIMGDGKTAVIEMAAASGLHLVSPEQRNPMLTTSYGTGELILAALEQGVEHIIVGIGGSATNDGGIGMAQALGVQLLDNNGQSLGFGGQALAQLATIDISHIDPRLATIKLEVACDVDNPLCGAKGASAVFGPQKGATPAMVTELDQNLAHYAAIIERDLAIDVKHMAGAGAAGGMGAALLGLFKAQLRSGIEIVIDAVNLDAIVKDADLVITGEGRIDSQTIHGKTPIGVARAAKKFNKPVIGIAGCLSQDCGVVYEHGIDAVFSVVPAAISLEQAFKDAAINVELTARNVAAMYCLGR
ncbi:glycerate kinase [Photobacterium kishitanii]|uniref:Glycerate kinase n=1 Tax=Photobacterium kishitanii TaxID=318456 RepID=A0AAX0YYF8_9GAMM|nr:glycerate kinase [Photobacterium kishitanii]KJG57769.1 glycerate kinase [Photobacterium kishitanii]KJG61383.1 glycerate kinase [Photobacterium kishitanii]KJG65537.1 glycerate kinase [Photobacterium kishitanii]KJG70373.1 glycerate kinase [Photobacterium kishitanii]PSX18039.1 glycerate kinase [Photobacterium kishitanii]